MFPLVEVVLKKSENKFVIQTFIVNIVLIADVKIIKNNKKLFIPPVGTWIWFRFFGNHKDEEDNKTTTIGICESQIYPYKTGSLMIKGLEELYEKAKNKS